MIRKDCIQVGDDVLIKSIICTTLVPATVTEVKEKGVYVDDGSCQGSIFVEYGECWYDTKENRKMIVNQKHY